MAKGRPRARARGSYIQMYTDQATQNWEAIVAGHLKAQVGMVLPAMAPLDCRLMVHFRFNLRRPASLSKKVQYPVKSRSDIDNYVKAVLDGMQNSGLIVNDNIVTDISACKRYVSDDHPEGVEIVVSPL